MFRSHIPLVEVFHGEEKKQKKPKNTIAKKPIEVEKVEVEELTEDTSNPRCIRFTENGRIEWEGFTNLYEVIGFMQLHIFQHWGHPIFQNVFLKDILEPKDKSNNLEEEIPEETLEEIVEEVVEEIEEYDDREDKKREIEEEMERLKSQLEEL